MSSVKSALAPGVRPVEVWAWAMFDFANSSYTTVVITAVFGAYFVAVVAEGADWATLAWTAALGVSYARGQPPSTDAADGAGAFLFPGAGAAVPTPRA